MDMLMIKLPMNHNVSVNDEAEIISDGTNGSLTIHDIAKLTQSNPREIMTRFSSRVRRQII